MSPTPDYGDPDVPSWLWGKNLPPSTPGHVFVHLRIPGSGVDYPVPFPRVPIVGEHITGPDDMGMCVVSEIDWQFDGGFGSPPVPFVVAKALR